MSEPASDAKFAENQKENQWSIEILSIVVNKFIDFWRKYE